MRFSVSKYYSNLIILKTLARFTIAAGVILSFTAGAVSSLSYSDSPIFPTIKIDDFDQAIISPRPYFISRRQTTDFPISFRLLAVDTITDAVTDKQTLLDNAFRLEFTVHTNHTNQKDSFRYTLIFDDLMREREIIKTDAQGREVLAISLGEDGGLVSIQETIPEELELRILFNPKGQMAVKTISAPSRLWEYHYRYREGRLAKWLSLYNGAVLNERRITWEPGEKGKEISRTEEMDGSGKKIRFWEAERDLTIRFGYGVEKIKQFTVHGSLREETLRLWAGGKINEEHVTRGKLYQRNTFFYDSTGLLQEKTAWDDAGEMLVHHYYHYDLPKKIEKLVFLSQLKMNSMEITYYHIGGQIALGKSEFFDLRTLVSSFREEIVNTGSITRRSYTGGLETIATQASNRWEKKIRDPQTGNDLSTRRFIYDSYGRISEVIHYLPDQSFTRSRFLYEETPEGVMSALPIPMLPEEGLYQGTGFLNHLKNRQKRKADEKNLPKTPPVSLEVQFQEFKKFGVSQKDAMPSREDHALISELIALRESKLAKIIHYNRKGKIDYYHRIEHSRIQISPELWEVKFTAYFTPPVLDLEKSRISVLLSESNDYYVPGYPNLARAAESSEYSDLKKGGREEFLTLAHDNIDPLQEKPAEIIVIHYNDRDILSDAEQTIFNQFTGSIKNKISFKESSIE